MTTIQCQECGKTFFAKRIDRKYCDDCKKIVKNRKKKEYEQSPQGIAARKAYRSKPEVKLRIRQNKWKRMKKKYPYDPNMPYKPLGMYTDEEFMSYRYSDEWAEKCKQKKKEAGYKCERCGRKQTEMDRQLVIHHKTYDNFRRERMEDLECLCHYCHAKESGKL